MLPSYLQPTRRSCHLLTQEHLTDIFKKILHLCQVVSKLGQTPPEPPSMILCDAKFLPFFIIQLFSDEVSTFSSIVFLFLSFFFSFGPSYIPNTQKGSWHTSQGGSDGEDKVLDSARVLIWWVFSSPLSTQPKMTLTSAEAGDVNSQISQSTNNTITAESHVYCPILGLLAAQFSWNSLS